MNRRALTGIVLLFGFFCTSAAGQTNPSSTQATPSGDVKVTYERDKITYWSSKHGISLSVPSHLRIWVAEFRTERNPLGEDSPYRNPGAPSRLLDVTEPSNDRYVISLRFVEKQLSDDKIQEWIATTIGRWPDAQRFGMPQRQDESAILLDGLKATKADYVWRNGARSLTVTFLTEKGTYFFYARPASYDDLNTLIKTISLVRR